MSQLIRKISSLLLTVVLLFGLACSCAFADNKDAASDEIWDIVLVLDCSASLFQNDRDNIRYEAIESLLWSLNADYAEVGVVLFRANDKPGADLRNGTKTFPIGSIKSEHERSNVMRQLKDDSGLARHESYQTDYYTALLVAQEMLSARNNNHPGAIFLFTDDELSVLGTDAKRAKDNLDLAIQNIRNNNIMVCGVYLNATNKTGTSSNSIPIRDIVSMSNEGDGRNLDDLYVEINDATECYEPTDHFLHALGYDMLIEGGQIIRTTTPMHFTLPGIGIDKLAIRLSTQFVARDTQIKNVVKSVVFKDPSGHTFNGDSVRSFRGLYRDVYELTRSDVERRGLKWAGEWTVTVEIQNDVDIGVIYDPVFTANVDVELEPADFNGLRAKTDLTIVTRLAQAAKSDDYEGYVCTLELVTPGGSKQVVNLSYDASVNGFPYLIPLTYGDYSATVKFMCSLVARNYTQSWTVVNLPPELISPLPDVRFSLLDPGSWVQNVDLSGHVSDEDNVQDLHFALQNSGSGIKLDGTSLELKGLIFGTAQKAYGADDNGLVTILVTDTEGATSQLSMHVEGGANALVLPLLIAALVLILLVLIIIILTVRSIMGKMPTEPCIAEFEVDGNHQISLSLPSPGTSSEVRRNTTLGQMLRAEISKGVIESINPSEMNAVREFVDEYSTELNRVRVSCATTTTTINGKKRKITVPMVQYDDKKFMLLNRSESIPIGEAGLTLGYELNDPERENFDSNDAFFDGVDWAPRSDSGSGEDDDF